MSMERSETDEEEQAEMLIRAMTEKNVTKIEQALAKTKKHGKGFVLSSHFYKPKPRSTSPKDRRHTPSQTPLPIVIGSPIGSPVPSRKPSSSQRSPPSRTKSAVTRRRKPEVIEESPRPQSAYLTEYIPPPIKVDMAIQSDEKEEPQLEPQPNSPPPPPGTPDVNQEESETLRESEAMVTEEATLKTDDEAETENTESFIDDEPPLVREEPLGDEAAPIEERRINWQKFQLLGLPRRPSQFQYSAEMPPTNIDKNPENPAPAHPNIWVTKVPKDGGDVNTPFYMQVHVPKGALRGDAIMKFETQSYKNSKLELNDTDKLCSEIIDVNMKPLAYCLHQKATVKVRILEDCINKFDDITFISARNFKWSRKPTKIETNEVRGQTLYYAVTETQQLGKFAVITTRKLDRFVMTSAGGLFASTVLPDVTITLNEGVLTDLAHLVEVSIQDTRQVAMEEANKEIFVRGVRGGELVASSPIVNITKEIMGRTGIMDDGVSFPGNVRFTVPLTTFAKQPDDVMATWKKPVIKIMQKVARKIKKETNGSTEEFGEDIQENGVGFVESWENSPDNGETPEENGKNQENGRNEENLPQFWTDITDKNDMLFDPVGIQKGGKVSLDARLPCQLLIFIFDDTTNEPRVPKDDVEDLCEEIERRNQLYDVAIMVHQKKEKPEIINIHVIPAKAKDLVAGAMKASGDWSALGEATTGVYVKEREHLGINFKGDVKLTINQMDPEIAFHSRRWQGHQYQIEATDEGYSNDVDVIGGTIELVQKIGDANKVVHSSIVTLGYKQAKPYRPTVIVRPLPKVSVIREYKLKWLKNLSEAEKAKYQSINTP